MLVLFIRSAQLHRVQVLAGVFIFFAFSFSIRKNEQLRTIIHFEETYDYDY